VALPRQARSITMDHRPFERNSQGERSPNRSCQDSSGHSARESSLRSLGIDKNMYNRQIDQQSSIASRNSIDRYERVKSGGEKTSEIRVLEIEQSSRSSSDGTNEIRPINEQASTSQHAPEQTREVYQELLILEPECNRQHLGQKTQKDVEDKLDSLIAQYDNDPKHNKEIRKAFVEFLKDKIISAKQDEKEKKLLEYAQEVDDHFLDDKRSYIKGGISKCILEDTYNCLRKSEIPRGYNDDRKDNPELYKVIDEIRSSLNADRQILEQSRREQRRQQRLEDMYGWRLGVWRKFKQSILRMQCVHPSQQEQSREQANPREIL
jgi:hypothetical protein